MKKRTLLLFLSLALCLSAAAGAILLNRAGRSPADGEAARSAKAALSPDPSPSLSPTPSPSPTPTPEPTPSPEPSSPTTGRTAGDGITPTYQPVMISIENASGARPQIGLNMADIVYEAPVEYAITRFHAVFNDEIPCFVGPVRSSRIYWMRLQQEWNTMYIHRGYGGEMYDGDWVGIHVEPYLMDTGDMFWRMRNRKEVHALMCNMQELVDTFYGDNIAVPKERFAFGEKADNGAGKPFEKVALNFFYRRQPEKNWITFRYNGETNTLSRFQDGKIFKTLKPLSGRSDFTARYEKEEFFTQNLIVQYVPFWEVDDSKEHRNTDLSGTGLCDYFINGLHYTGTWERKTYETHTRYYLDNGALLTLEKGRTWICLHPNDYALSPVAITYSDGTRLERGK